MAPHVVQVDATRAALEDSSLARLTAVGTSHAFQGRQFDTVLADLVEDGRGRMPRANLRSGERDVDSVRLFNTDPPPPDGPEADLVTALVPYVRINGLHDEDAAIDDGHHPHRRRPA